ncbi:MAG: serine/threonine protein kinase [Proteobacteria bacterium]|jgi:serine/threonine-protein kinase|nr:serine/threonine protein kinase [Pseudomonadota bacterium]
MPIDNPTPIEVTPARRGRARAAKNAPDAMRGRVLSGRYRITQRIARGGMGTVYLARSTEDGSPVAVKVLRDDLLLDLQVRERFMYESRAASRIVHPAVARTYEVGETAEGELFIVMEYVNGPPLRKLIRAGRMSTLRVVLIGAAIAEGLAAAHEKGVIHRDLKPENVLLPRGSQVGSVVKLVDFGIARIVDAPRITTTQHVLGTPQYVSPEQAMGGPIDSRSDVYALGVILYEMIAGLLPFDGDDPQAILRKHVKSRPTPLHELGVAVAPDLERLVMRCLEKSPRSRPDSMEQIIAALAALD